MPDRATITDFLHTITHRWAELEEPSLLEIRAIEQNSPPGWQQFPFQDIEAAATYAAEQNVPGRNLYACVNPVSTSVTGAASDKDILAAFFSFADGDDEQGADAISNYTPYPPDFIVNTGTIPWSRVHGYWELEEPCRDLSTWRSIQIGIAKTLGTDPKVVNPSRVMRLAGTVAYPNVKKANDGYVTELTTLNFGGVK
jgi:hypothetical protein